MTVPHRETTQEKRKNLPSEKTRCQQHFNESRIRFISGKHIEHTALERPPLQDNIAANETKGIPETVKLILFSTIFNYPLFFYLSIQYDINFDNIHFQLTNTNSIQFCRFKLDFVKILLAVMNLSTLKRLSMFF